MAETETSAAPAPDTASPAPAAPAPDASAAAPAPATNTPPAPAKPEGAAPTAIDTVAATPVDDAKTKAPTWGDDWRESVAGDDEKTKKLLERYNSPKDLIKAHTELQKKLSSGEYRKPLGKDATPEQIAEHRKQNGIPETADGYLEKLPKGLVLGDTDREAFKPFLEAMHAKNASPEFVTEAIAAYNKAQEDAMLKQYDLDLAAKDKFEDSLRTEWGAEFRENTQRIKNMLAGTFSEDFMKALGNARVGDESNTPLFSHPDFARGMAQLARELNPTGRVTPGKGMDNAAGINEEITRIENNEMGVGDWYNNPAKQARYRELLDARERYK